MVSVNFSLTGGNGDTIVFDNENYVLNPGMTGFGIPATEVRITESARDGGLWRNTKRGIRDLDLPITVLGNNRAEVETKLRRLARLTQDRLGPTSLSANYSNGTQLSMQVHYVGGAESQWGEDAGMIWCRWLLSFQAPTPFWESAEVEQFTVVSGSAGRGLLPQLTKLKLTSGQAIGSITVNNTGDVAAYPVWTVIGPLESVTFTSGNQSFGLETPIEAGEVITINSETGIVTDQDGANRYADLSPAPKLFPLSPGVSTVNILGEGADPNTQIICSYQLRFEVVH